MIFTTIINAGLSILTYIISYFPDVTGSDQARIDTMSTTFETLRGYFSNINFVFPIDTVFTVLQMIIVIEIIIAIVRIVRWIASNVTLGFIK